MSVGNVVDPAVRVLILDDTRFDGHVAPAYHPERPERLTAARAAVARLVDETAASGAADGGQGFGAPEGGVGARARPTAVQARPATDEELARVHDPRFVEALEALRGESGFIDADTYVAPRSVEAARLAAGGLVAMVDAMIDGAVSKGIALLRPPGHHATPARAMGFCLLNSVAVAAAHARARGLSRVAVIDWDVHHGNGTQDAFFGDPSVLYASLHQHPFYPGTGAAADIGDGEGRGYTVNVPLSAHAGDGIYRGAFERVLLPVLDAYAPELVLVSAGFDASARDPLAQMELSAEAFGWMAAALRDVADRHGGGKMALVLEGGYDLVALESGLFAAGEAMLGTGQGPRIARDVDDGDVARAAREAQSAWAGVL